MEILEKFFLEISNRKEKKVLLTFIAKSITHDHSKYDASVLSNVKCKV